MKNIVFLGLNPELSTAIQRHYFKLGYQWATSNRQVSHINESILTLSENKRIQYNYNRRDNNLYIDFRFYTIPF